MTELNKDKSSGIGVVEDTTLRTLRSMAWERAKGELQALLHTYYGDSPRYDRIEDKINDFIKEFDNII